MRIISLVPSLTHTVAALGLEDFLVGCTKFCVKPRHLHKAVAMVGGTKDPDLDQIRALKPTHILTNEEENKPEHIAACESIAPTFRCFPKTPLDVGSLLMNLGGFFAGQGDFAKQAEVYDKRLVKLTENVLTSSRNPWTGKRFLYFIWKAPYMVAGPDTYISHALGLVGLINAYPCGERYPSLTAADLAEVEVDYIFLSSEPYPFRRRDYEQLLQEWPTIPEAYKVDGQIFSWYGVEAFALLDALLFLAAGELPEAFKRLP